MKKEKINLNTIIDIQFIISRCYKLRYRNTRESIRHDLTIFLFCFFQSILIYTLNLFLTISKSTNTQAENNEFSILIQIIELSLLFFIFAFFIFGTLKLLIFFSQKILRYKEEINTKYLLGVTVSHISSEIVIESFLGVPFIFIFNYLLSKFIVTKFLYLLLDIFPIGNAFESSVHTSNLFILGISPFILILTILISLLFVKCKILKSTKKFKY